MKRKKHNIFNEDYRTITFSVEEVRTILRNHAQKYMHVPDDVRLSFDIEIAYHISEASAEIDAVLLEWAE